MKKSGMPILLFVLFSILMIGSSRFTDRLQPLEQDWQHMLYLPNADFLRIASFNNAATVADYLWIKTVLYLGRYHDIYEAHYQTGHHHGTGESAHIHASTHDSVATDSAAFIDSPAMKKLFYSFYGKKYLVHLYPLLETITDLDPYFVKPYTLSAFILARETGQLRESLALLNKGIHYNPERWELYYWKGFLYLFYFDDMDQVIENFSKAAAYPQCPQGIINMLPYLYAGADKIDIGINYLQSLYENNEDPVFRKQILNSLQELYEQKKKKQRNQK